MRDKRRKSTTPGSEPPTREASELPQRWSVQRKTELALRLLRGEPSTRSGPQMLSRASARDTTAGYASRARSAAPGCCSRQTIPRAA